ncbi:LuxR family transcriptional regulator [Actinocorallia lasiicapitis]
MNQPREVRLLERREELHMIDDLLDRSAQGGGGGILLLGPAGIGKTSLLGAALVRAETREHRVMSASGSTLRKDTAFGLLLDAFGAALEGIPREERAAMFAGAAASAAPLFDRADSREHGGEFELLHGLFWLMLNLGRGAPVLLLLDNLQLADESSLRFLAFTQNRLENERAALLCATRPESHSAAAQRLLDLMITHPASRVRRPRPLSRSATGELIADRCGLAPGEEFLSACHHETGGNPLYVSELVRGLSDQGLTPVDELAERVTTIGSSAISWRVSQELARLTGAAKATATALAALGPDADLQRISEVTGLTMDDVLVASSELEAAHLVRGPAAGTAGPPEFTHPLLLETVYSLLSQEEAVRIHRAATDALSESGATPEEISAHLLRAGRPRPADLPILVEAAKTSTRRGALGAANIFLRHALQAEQPAAGRLALLLEAALIASQVDMAGTLELVDEAFELTDDPLTRAALAGMAGTVAPWLARADLIELVVRCAEGLPPEADDLRRRLESILLGIPQMLPGWDHLLPRLEAARKLLPSSSVEGALLEAMIASWDMQAAHPQAFQRASTALANPGFRSAVARGALSGTPAFIVAFHDEPKRGIRAYSALIHEAQLVGSLSTLAFTQMWRGSGWHRIGQLAEAAEDFGYALEAERLAPSGPVLEASLGMLAAVRIDQGDLEDAERLLRRSDELPPDSGVFYYSAHAWALLHFARERYADALRNALSARQRYAMGGGRNPAVLACRGIAALSLHRLGRHDEAVEVAATELVIAREWGRPGALGRSLRVNGLVCADRDGRRELLRESARILEGTDYLLDLAETLCVLGEDELDSGDLDAVQEYLGRSLDLAHRCGANLLTERARRALRRAGYRPRRTALTGPKSLTPSESRVAELAARGQTNREIAQSLFVTVKTVEVHLSNAYRKLQISKRSQIEAELRAED